MLEQRRLTLQSAVSQTTKDQLICTNRLWSYNKTPRLRAIAEKMFVQNTIVVL